MTTAVMVDGRGLMAVVEAGHEGQLGWTMRALAAEEDRTETVVIVESAVAAERNFEGQEA